VKKTHRRMSTPCSCDVLPKAHCSFLPSCLIVSFCCSSESPLYVMTSASCLCGIVVPSLLSNRAPAGKKLLGISRTIFMLKSSASATVHEEPDVGRGSSPRQPSFQAVSVACKMRSSARLLSCAFLAAFATSFDDSWSLTSPPAAAVTTVCALEAEHVSIAGDHQRQSAKPDGQTPGTGSQPHASCTLTSCLEVKQMWLLVLRMSEAAGCARIQLILDGSCSDNNIKRRRHHSAQFQEASASFERQLALLQALIH
jgi:hypothetical protein